MDSWRYFNPVQVRFGWGVASELAGAAKGRRAWLVTFPEARGLGLIERVERWLAAPLAGVTEDVQSNPGVTRVERQHAEFWGQCTEGARADVIVALGGGSVIDTAKLLATCCGEGGFPAMVARLRESRQPCPAKSVPIIALPTTAGTGSEVTPWASLWDHNEAGTSMPAKYSLNLPELWPEAALIDPELTLTAPLAVAQHASLDALSHALESIWNVSHNSVSDALAVDAARLILTTLPQLAAHPNDARLRTRLSRASLLAGLAFSNTRTALAHSISYPLTLNLGLPHGLACSFALPIIWRMARGHDASRDQVLNQIFGATEPDPPARLDAWLRGLGIATRFSDYGLDREAARALVANAAGGERGRNFIADEPLLDWVA